MFDSEYGYDPDIPFRRQEQAEERRERRRQNFVPEPDPVETNAPVVGAPVDIEPYVPAGYAPSAPPSQAWYDSGGGGGGGQQYGNFEIPQYQGPMSPEYEFYEAPEFIPPPDFVAPEWAAPTMEQAYNEPGYALRLRSGMEAMQNSAAAKGVLRTGGTLSDLLEYGQNFASQEYGNVFDRALRSYGQQYEGARDQYATAYQRSKDEYAPQFSQWQMLSAAERERALAEFQRYWDIHALGIEGDMAREGWIQNLLPPSPDFGGY